MQVEDLENDNLQAIQLLSLRVQLAAGGIASSFLLIFVPNIETITFTAFLVGLLFPLGYALSITLTMVIGWEVLVSMVFAFSGLTFFFKLIAWLLITVLGTVARKIQVRSAYEFAIFGAISAFLFDFLVTIPFALFYLDDKNGFVSVLLTSLIFGIYFTVFHTLGNTILFSFIPKLIDTLSPILENRYAHLVKINQAYFQEKSKHALSIIVLALLITSLLGIGIINYDDNQNSSTQDQMYATIILQFDYADLRQDESYQLNVSVEKSVFEVIQLVVVINYTMQYGGLPFIQAINGIWNNKNISGYNWIFYINQVVSVRGASLTNIQNSDIILWKYE